MSDKIDVYKQFLAGEPSGVNLIFLAHKGPLLAYGFKLLSRTDAAEDAVSDAFMVLLEHIGQFKSGKHIQNFLYLVVWNKCQVERRTLRRFSMRPEDAEELIDLSPPELMDIKESALHIQWIVNKIQEKLQQLPKRRRQDFYAYFFESKSIEKIAREKGVSATTIRQNIALAEKKIQKYLKKG
jgi:RNA polymerase sigma-70 factor (ECF subfamily)